MRKKYRDLAVRLLHGRRLPNLLGSGLRLSQLGTSALLHRRRTTPLVATLIPTYRCNARCPKCEKSKLAEQRAELPTADFVRIIDDCAQMGVPVIDFTGGEPLLRSDILELIEHSKSTGRITHLNTNASLIDAARADALLRAGVDSINVSLDTLGAVHGMAITGRKDGVERVIAGLQHLLAARERTRHQPLITLVVVLSNANLSEIDELIGFAERSGVDGVTFNPLHRFPDPLSHADEVGDLAATSIRLLELQRAHPLIENSRAYFELLSSYYQNQPLPIPCVAARAGVIIDTYARVFPCFCWLEIGQQSVPLRRRPLRQLLDAPDYREVLDAAHACRRCYWNCHAELSLLMHPFTKKRLPW